MWVNFILTAHSAKSYHRDIEGGEVFGGDSVFWSVIWWYGWYMTGCN